MRATIDCSVPGAVGSPLAPPMSPAPGSVSWGVREGAGCLGNRDVAVAAAATAVDAGPAA
jgi:hypothetical protein